VEPEPGRPDAVSRVLGALDHLLDRLHDRVLRPILIVGRFVAFSFVIFLCALVVVVALLIAITRLMDVYFFSGRIWANDLLLGFVFIVGGMVFWRFRAPVKTRK
jgi:hypothetical protein